MKANFLTKCLLLWGVFWGVLSLTLFLLGTLGLWQPWILKFTFVVFLGTLFYFLGINQFWKKLKIFAKNFFKSLIQDKILIALLIVFLFFVGFYLLGAIAPEREFDSLWYHLTLPKIWLMHQKVHFISGGLLYYSEMPRLSEMIYGLTLVFDPNGIFAKLIHFSFGVFWALISYEILRIYFLRRLSLILTIIIYSVPIVGWLSGTAYIDLIVCFYVAASLWGFLKYFQTQDKIYLFASALMMGFNLEAKLYGWFIFGSLAFVLLLYRKYKEFFIFSLIGLVMALPYLISAYLATKNPIYPVFTIQDSSFEVWIDGVSGYKQWLAQIWLKKLPVLFWQMVTFRFAPVFGLIFLLPFIFRKNKMLILATLIFIIFFLAFSLHPLGEVRYFMVILPVLATLIGYVITEVRSWIFRFLVAVLMIWGLWVNYNTILNDYKLPLELAKGKISRQEYLKKHIGGVWFNFYDVDGYFEKNLLPGDKIITINYHNLFYVDGNFADWSYIGEGKKFQSPKELNEFLRKRQFTFVAIAKDPIEKYFGFSDNDIDSYFEKVYQGQYSFYYEIK